MPGRTVYPVSRTVSTTMPITRPDRASALLLPRRRPVSTAVQGPFTVTFPESSTSLNGWTRGTACLVGPPTDLGTHSHSSVVRAAAEDLVVVGAWVAADLHCPLGLRRLLFRTGRP